MPQQRLLLALGLTAAVLLLWTALIPPPTVPISQTKGVPSPGEREILSTGDAPLPPQTAFLVGSLTFGIGEPSGGVHSLRLDGLKLLADSNPGIFQVELLEPQGPPLRFETKEETGRLVSTAGSESDQWAVRREISPPKEISNSFYSIVLQISNRGKERKSFQPKLVVYRPIYAWTAEEQRYQGGFIWSEGRAHAVSAKPTRKPELLGSPDWISSQGKSHMLVLRPLQPGGMFHVEHSKSGAATGWLELPKVEIPPGEEAKWDFSLYAGPIDLETLRAVQMEDTVSFGAFPGISKLLIEFMDWSKRWLGDYGLSICLLSIAVWLPFSPLTWYGTRVNMQMMEKMGRIKPQEAKIRKEQAKNPQRMQQELMELYKKNGVNPASGCIGCLPMLLSMPIYIALFQVLNRAPQLRGAKFLWIHDLSAPDALVRFPSALPLIGESLNILPILSVVGMFFQQKMMKPPQETLTDEQKIQQQMFMFMPLMLLLFFYNLPSGFVLYWVINSGLMTGQQLLIKRIHRI